jgi:hypothetical protein
MGDLHYDGSPVGHNHRESGEPRSTRVNPHLGALGAQSDRQRVGEPCHFSGIRREEVYVLGRSIHQIVGPASRHSGQGDLPSLLEVSPTSMRCI